MSQRTVQHGTFTLEREFAFPPAHVFAAHRRQALADNSVNERKPSWAGQS
jgi:hypothetical protein